ncbi:MAG TPA: HEPN domain-containing protein, partial [Bacteroidales bacterium]|jgi:HEPN domain-containing protein|nr:HEPN domain-containing protein [Bacteroidales bacterium]HQH24634.1 HEPN domain-containing protein [Bacteroidales bacterium]HQJ82928.1 HEPN domain-containing protein [Bacteroidales bacterium]
MKKATEEWFESAESDLLLIHEIHSNENLTHMVAFHAQQAVEKAFKALIEEFDLGFIKTHSLEMLYNIIRDKILIKPDLKESSRFYSFALEIVEAAKKSCDKA